MLDTFEPVIPSRPQRKKILKELIEREKSLTSYIGEGVALPHARVNMKRPYALAVGRCPAGLDFEGKNSYEDIRFVFLLLASEKAKNYLSFLASLARSFQDSSIMDQLWMARDRTSLRNAVRKAFIGTDDRPARRRTKFNKLQRTRHRKLPRLRSVQPSWYLPAFSSFPDSTDDLPQLQSGTCWRRGFGRRPGTSSSGCYTRSPFPLPLRLSQLRAAILLGLTRDIFGFQDRVCCIGGIPGSGQFDTVLVVDVDEEFESVIGQGDEMLPPDVSAEALESLTAIATDLATSGREGKSIGAMFVLGDHEKVLKRSKQLVLNPFHGYGEEDRSVLNPFMDETIKELALIDGAFIVRGNGVVESAGCLIQAKADEIELPGGLGTVMRGRRPSPMRPTP